MRYWSRKEIDLKIESDWISIFLNHLFKFMNPASQPASPELQRGKQGVLQGISRCFQAILLQYSNLYEVDFAVGCPFLSNT